MLSVDHLMSPFTFSEFNPADVTRYVPLFDVQNYKERIRRYLSTDTTGDGCACANGNSVRSPTLNPTSPATSDEIFTTPTTDFPHPFKALGERKKEKLFDPYQIFEVEHRPCLLLEIKVICGRNITKGWADYVDTPDPYIHMTIKSAPEGRKQTTVKDNEVNPVWNETFVFLLDEKMVAENTLEMRLMEANLMYDELVGTEFFKLSKLHRNQVETKTFIFNGVSEIDVEMKLSLDTNPTLRYSLCLCEKEKEYIEKRKVKVMESMQKLLGDKGPANEDQVPTVGIIGSGGGFRAMVGMSGVVKALHDSGILQCSTYLCGLSGSSWYISTLYSHNNWPQMSPGDMQDELKNNIDSSLLWLLKPQGVYRYMDRIMKKRQMGQPVSFTDFFGHMVGETLLKSRLDSKLSDQQAKLAEGTIPMPLLTCVHVKKDRSARSFQEWVEFSPYEIGLAKYGTFMPTELFGSKFFMGKLCKEFEEPPLHFLQGIWGSAFCILFKRLLDDNRKLDPVEMIRQEMAKQLEENEQDESSDSSDEGDFNDAEEPQSPSMAGDKQKATTLPRVLNRTNFQSASSQQNGRPGSIGNGPPRDMTPKRLVSTRRTKQKGYWSNFLKGVFENKNFELLSTRAGRAGVIHNFMRGLSLQQSYPLSPFTPLDKSAPEDFDSPDGPSTRVSDDFDGIFEMHPTNVKHLYMVDAGLTFNSPYPVVLRPQREVDIILSFDFSARPSDSTPPFKELLLAEQWAKKHKVSFPPIDTSVIDREGMKEMYVFKHPNDPHCPIVLHFCLVNIEFRKFIKPGIKRREQSDKEFADFDIFDDQSTPYSTFNFKYSHLAFDRLSKLTEFNTLLNIENIKAVFSEAVEKKKDEPSRCPCTLEDVPLLRRVSQKNKKRLSKFLSRIRSGRFSISEARRGIDKSLEEDTIVEETSSIDSVDSPVANEKLKRRPGKTIRFPNKTVRALSTVESTSIDQPSPTSGAKKNGTEEDAAEKRDIPGRRKPRQHERAAQWHDTRCFSLDEDDADSQFFTAYQPNTPSPR